MIGSKTIFRDFLQAYSLSKRTRNDILRFLSSPFIFYVHCFSGSFHIRTLPFYYIYDIILILTVCLPSLFASSFVPTNTSIRLPLISPPVSSAEATKLVPS